jgi:tRNA pseudouridine65 synthase
MTDAPLELLYRDEALAVVNKPAGLLAHRSQIAAHEDRFLLDSLREQLGQRCFLAHRLDRATSGALLLAFDKVTAAALGEQFMGRSVQKTYLAVVRGWTQDEGSIDHPLDAPGKPEPKPALSHFNRLAAIELPIPMSGFETARYSLLAIAPETGRYRQLRRHLKHIHHHLIGDTSHGDGRHNRLFRAEFRCHRMLLHAWRLSFSHPHSGERMTLEAGLDAEFMQLLERFGWGNAFAPARDWNCEIRN